MGAVKKLVANGDDFGFTRDVNAGIVAAHREGILTATTLMANGAACDDAVRLAREVPTLDIGCHLVLVGSAPYPATVAALIRALAARKIRVYDELRSQISKIADAGITPTHLDTHKHTHLLPPVLDAVARLSEEFRIPWVRRPFDFPMEAACVPCSASCVRHIFPRRYCTTGPAVGSSTCMPITSVRSTSSQTRSSPAARFDQ